MSHPFMDDTEAMYAGSLKSLKSSLGMVMPKTRWSTAATALSSGESKKSTADDRRRRLPGSSETTQTSHRTDAAPSQKRYSRGKLHPLTSTPCDPPGVKKVRTELVPPTFKDNPQDDPEHLERRVSSSSHATLSSLSDESIEQDAGTSTACQRSRQHIETVVENMRHEASKCGKDGAIRELNFFLCESGPIDSNHSLNQPQGSVVFYRVFPNPSYVPPTDPEAATVVSPMKTRLEAHRNMQHCRRIKNFVTMSNMVATEKYETYRATLAMVREAVEERAGYLGAKFTDTEEAFLLDELDHFMKSLPFGANQPVGLQSLAHIMLDHAIDIRTAHLAALLHASRQSLQSVSPDVKAMHDALNLQGDYSRIMFRFMDAARVYAMMHLGAYSNLSAPQKEVMASVTEKFRDLNENNRLSTDPYVDLYKTLTECFSPQLRYRALHLPWLFHSALDAEHLQRFFLEACAPKDQSTAVYDNGSRRHEMTTYVVCAGKAKLEEYGLWDRQLIAGGVPQKHVALPRQFGGAVYVGADLCLVRDVDNKKVFDDSGPHLVRYSFSRNGANGDVESAQALCIALFTSLGDALPNQDVARFLRQQTAMGNVTVALGAPDADQGRQLLDLYEVSGQAVVFAPKTDRTWTKRRNDARTMFVPVPSGAAPFHDHVLDAASGYDAMSVVIDESTDPECVSFALVSVLCSVDDSVRVHLHKNWMLPKNRPHTGDVAAVVRTLEQTPVPVGKMDNLKHAMEKAAQHGDVYVADLLTSKALHGNASPWTTEISEFYTFTNLFGAKKMDANAVHAFVSEMAEKKKPGLRPLSKSDDAQKTHKEVVQPENAVQTRLAEAADAVQTKVAEAAESTEALKRDVVGAVQTKVAEAAESAEALKRDVVDAVQTKVAEAAESAEALKRDVVDALPTKVADVVESAETLVGSFQQKAQEALEISKAAIDDTVASITGQVDSAAEDNAGEDAREQRGDQQSTAAPTTDETEYRPESKEFDRKSVGSFQKNVQEALKSAKATIENTVASVAGGDSKDDAPVASVADDVAFEDARETRDDQPPIAVPTTDGTDDRSSETTSTRSNAKRIKALKRIGLKSNLKLDPERSTDDQKVFTDQNGDTWRESTHSDDKEVFVTKEGTGGWERLRFPLRLIKG